MGDLSVSYVRDVPGADTIVLLWHTDDEGRRRLAGRAERDGANLWRAVLFPLHDTEERRHLGWFTDRTSATLALLTSGDLILVRDYPA